MEFATALIEAGLANISTLLERANMLDDTHSRARRAVRDWLEATDQRLQNS